MINNQTPQSNTSEIFAQFKNDIWSKPMKPVSNNTNTNVLQNFQNSEKKVEAQPKTNTVEQDTFVKENTKKDKKKIAKYVAIGTGLAAIAYSAFALIKYRNDYSLYRNRLAEPIKTLKARRNPYDYRPKTDIKDFDTGYMMEAGKHVRRLTNKQKIKYIQILRDYNNFNEREENLFNIFVGKYLN